MVDPSKHSNSVRPEDAGLQVHTSERVWTKSRNHLRPLHELITDVRGVSVVVLRRDRGDTICTRAGCAGQSDKFCTRAAYSGQSVHTGVVDQNKFMKIQFPVNVRRVLDTPCGSRITCAWRSPSLRQPAPAPAPTVETSRHAHTHAGVSTLNSEIERPRPFADISFSVSLSLFLSRSLDPSMASLSLCVSRSVVPPCLLNASSLFCDCPFSALLCCVFAFTNRIICVSFLSFVSYLTLSLCHRYLLHSALRFCPPSTPLLLASRRVVSFRLHP